MWQSSFSFKVFVTYNLFITATHGFSESSIALHNMQLGVVESTRRIPWQTRRARQRHLVGFNKTRQITENADSWEAFPKA